MQYMQKIICKCSYNETTYIRDVCVGILFLKKQTVYQFLAHLSRRLRGELLVYQWLRRPSPSVVCPSTFSNIFSSETTGPIELKFHMETP